MWRVSHAGALLGDTVPDVVAVPVPDVVAVPDVVPVPDVVAVPVGVRNVQIVMFLQQLQE
jgi:hypothetical protein